MLLVVRGTSGACKHDGGIPYCWVLCEASPSSSRTRRSSFTWLSSVAKLFWRAAVHEYMHAAGVRGNRNACKIAGSMSYCWVPCEAIRSSSRTRRLIFI